MRGQKMGLFILIFTGIFAARTFSQPIPDSTAQSIDKLFLPWNSTGSPGCTIGIVRGDSLIYAKGYGMANLEYGIPNGRETIFHMASISKQFAGYSIALLAKQGRLSLEDDVRKYLKWFPDLKDKITIRHVLNHTSGLRDQWQLLAISGTRLDDVITQEHIIKVLSRQQALNFKPGEKYSYSNSGFTVIAEIVKSVTGQSLRQFTDSAIFKPLGMGRTHFHDDYTEIEKGRSYSYDRTDSAHLVNSILSFGNSGATSLFTNVPDMSKWIMNFYHTTSGDAQDIALLTQRGRLNNGKELNYALGIISDEYRGHKRFSHTGSDAGYRTVMTVFPDLKMGFMVFANDGDFNPARKADEMADLLIPDVTSKKNIGPKASSDSSVATLKNQKAAQRFSGDYIAEDGLRFSFRLFDQKLYWEAGNNRTLLVNINKDSFSVFNHPEQAFAFRVNGIDDTLVTQYWPGNTRTLSKFTMDTAQTAKQLQAYTGVYYCPELDCSYRIVLKDRQLWLTNSKYNDTRLRLLGKNRLVSDYWWMDHLIVIRDAKQIIRGFEVSSGRIKRLRFNLHRSVGQDR